MPGRPPLSFPTERRLLAAFGERLRLARKRRKFSAQTVAARADISRTTLHHVEKGDPAVTFGTYARVLAVLGLEKDLEQLAADDALGRRLQDLALDRGKRP